MPDMFSALTKAYFGQKEHLFCFFKGDKGRAYPKT